MVHLFVHIQTLVNIVDCIILQLIKFKQIKIKTNVDAYHNDILLLKMFYVNFKKIVNANMYICFFQSKYRM